MTGDWAVALRDPEARRWLEVSDWAFWLKHPEVLDAEPSSTLSFRGFATSFGKFFSRMSPR